MNDHNGHEVQLTAYALGELSPDEVAAFEVTLTDEDCEQIEAIRDAASQLENALANEAPMRAPTVREGSASVSDQTPPLRLGLATDLEVPQDNRDASSLQISPFRPFPLLAAAAVVAGGITAGLVLNDQTQETNLSLQETEASQVIREEGREDTLPMHQPPAPRLGDEFREQVPRVEQKQQSVADAEHNELESNLLPADSLAAADAKRQNSADARDAFARTPSRGSSPAVAARSPAPALPTESAGGGGGGFGGGGDALTSLRRPAAAAEMLQRHRLGLTPESPEFRHARVQPPPNDREDYGHLEDNDFASPLVSPLSTFSVDVDTASYANVRRFLNDGQLPPKDAVRIEELVNYFTYSYPAPAVDAQVPFAADVVVTDSPWNAGNKLVRIGIQSAKPDAQTRPGANLVFLIDVSGSMNSPDKLPLVQQGQRRLASGLDDRDSLAMVAYAGNSGVVLPPTNGSETQTIEHAIDNLSAGGSTNGAAGIEQAYDMAASNFRPGGVNRVILATDGDFNVGTSDTGSLVRLVEERASQGIYLTVLGFGTGNLNDAMLEEISNKGDGNYAYIDSEQEAGRVLGDQLLSNIQTVAKDVKLQVEFNPAAVTSYRLIGYANRTMADEDFADDTKDAGDVGVAQQVTVIYEIVPAATAEAEPALDLKYQTPPTQRAGIDPSELATIKLRWKLPDAAKEQGTSELAEFVVGSSSVPFADADDDTQHAILVAGFGMMLRDSDDKGNLTWPGLMKLTSYLVASKDSDRDDPEMSRREEFRLMVERAAALAGE